MGEQVTLEMIYAEVKRAHAHLSLIEEVIGEVVLKGLPEGSLSKKKLREIDASVQEMKKGNCVNLEELKSAL